MGILTNLSNRIKGTIGELKVKKEIDPSFIWPSLSSSHQ